MAKNRRFVVTLEIEFSEEEDGEWTQDGVGNMIENVLGCENSVEEVEIIKVKEKKSKYEDKAEGGEIVED
jgi:hypothetical protein